MHEVAYTYDGSLEGLLTAVFSAYEYREQPVDIAQSKNLQLRLGQEVRDIATDEEKALRVYKSINASYGAEVFNTIKTASLSDEPRTGTIVYRFIRLLTDKKPARARLLDNFSHPEIIQLQQLNRSVYNERHYIMQFLRFEHLDNDVWFATCNPKASIVPLIMDWFSARFNTQAFIIYDEIHDIAGVYEGKEWYLVRSDAMTLPGCAEDEHAMQTAWRRFYDTIAVESRYNPELRRQFMPKRFWKNITEMQGA